ncbi:MAG: phosphatase PAP2 family protein [Pseudomonadota bacterium]
MAITVLGGTAVMAPAGAAVALWLAAGRRWRLARDWCLLLGAGLAVVVLSKLAFIGWGVGLASIEFAGFSGHAMRAAAILPVLMYVMLINAERPLRLAGVAAALALALLISLSRVVIGFHSASEALFGFLLGLGVAFSFIWLARRARGVALGRALVLLSLCALLLTPQLRPVPTEALLTRLALYLSGHERPFTRADWARAARRAPASAPASEPASEPASAPAS